MEIKVDAAFKSELKKLSEAVATLGGSRVSIPSLSGQPAGMAFREAMNELSDALVDFKILADNNVDQLNQFIEDISSLDNS